MRRVIVLLTLMKNAWAKHANFIHASRKFQLSCRPSSECAAKTTMSTTLRVLAHELGETSTIMMMKTRLESGSSVKMKWTLKTEWINLRTWAIWFAWLHTRHSQTTTESLELMKLGRSEHHRVKTFHSNNEASHVGREIAQHCCVLLLCGKKFTIHSFSHQ